MTILEAAREMGIDIPTLCYLEGVHEAGACRVCIVEVKGARTLVPACITEAADGMEIFTHTSRVRRARRTIIELMLSDHPDECLTCGKNNQCELQKLARAMNIQERKYEGEYSSRVIDDGSPAVIRDSGKCILCRRCLSVCSMIQDVNAIAPIGRGFKTVIAPAGKEPINQSPCVQCGQCVNVCPTGAIIEKVMLSGYGRHWKILETRCSTGCRRRVAIGEVLVWNRTSVTGKMVSQRNWI